MSYDVQIGTHDSNYTYNVWPMLHLAIDGEKDGRKGIYVLHGAPATEAGGILARAVSRMDEDPQTYAALNPTNGWGDANGCRDWLAEMAEACFENPTAFVDVS